ncbi:hypothetical protein KAR04_04900, partial [Candidatus Calescamantes bacterium]|nr:hypothetical protein [Candidatus Calescamantes bacterium]
MRKVLRIFIAILILSTGIHSTRYITFDDSEPFLKLKAFLGENIITFLVNSPDGRIFGGTGSGADGGNAIIFHFDPTLITDYSYGYGSQYYPAALLRLAAQVPPYKNIRGISILETDSQPDTILVFADVEYDIAQTQPYGIFALDYDLIYSTDVVSAVKIGTSAKDLKYISAFSPGPERSGKNPLLYIAADSDGGWVEVFDPETMTFIDTMAFDIRSATADIDYLGNSFACDGTDVFLGSLSIGSTAKIFSLHQDGSGDLLFAPGIEFFRNDDTAPTLQTGISAMEYYNGRIYCGTLSASTKYGGNLFYYDLTQSTGAIIGDAYAGTKTLSVTDMMEWDGEIYGATGTKITETDTYGNPIGYSRLFKISSSGSIDSREMLDYRAPSTVYYNPSWISAICKSPLSRDIVFGTNYNGGEDLFGGLIGLTDFYPPSAPAIKRIEKHEGRYRIYISPTGDDHLFGEATEYRISGGDSALADNPFGMKTPIETTDHGDYLEAFSIDHPYLYIRAFDNVYNYPSFADVQFTLSNIKVFPNPAIQKDGVNIYLPASTDKVNIYDISGNEIPASAFVISQATNSEGMLNYFWDLKTSAGDKVSSGIYLISVFDID